MAYNGSGTFVRVYSWADDDANDIPIRSDRADGEDDGFATGLSTAICKDGQTTITANIPFAGFKITGLGAATATTDAVQLQQVMAGTGMYVAVSGTNSYTATPTPAIAAYAAGQGFRVVFTNANTTSATLAVSGLTAKAITVNGATALVAGDITAGMAAWVIYDGTQFQLIPSKGTPGPFGLTNGGSLTTDSATANVGSFYQVPCTASARIIVLQSGSALTDRITISKYGTNTLTLHLQGSKFNGSTTNPVTIDEGVSQMVYTGSDRGWVEG